VPELALTMAADRTETDGQAGADENLLLKLAKTGDATAFEGILIRHERLVYRTAFRLLGRMEDAQDAAQEAFLRLHKHLRRFDESRALVPWLYRITVNVCRDIEARRRRNRTLPLDDAAAEPCLGVGIDERRVLERALARLPDKERAAIVLRDVEGLSTREVARVLGSSESTVRSQISSARLKIRQFAGRLFGRMA